MWNFIQFSRGQEKKLSTRSTVTDNGKKIQDATVLHKFYKMYKVLCFSTTTKKPFKCRYVHDMKILLYSHSNGFKDRPSEKAACKKILGLERISPPDTDLQYKMNLVLQLAKRS